jgi:hypothetical protein
LDAGDIVLAFGGGALFLIARAWRTHALLGARAPWWPLVGQTGVAWGAGLLLPGPAADATFVVLARRLGIGVRRSTSVAVIGRILDIISLALIVVVTSAITGIDETQDAIVITAGIGAAFLVLLIAVLSRPGRAVLVSSMRRVPRLRNLAESAGQAVHELSGARQILSLAGATIACRVATLIQYTALFSMVGLHVGLWSVWLVLALRTFLSTIPVQGLAGLGTGQLWWAGALIFAGIPAGSAIGISITVSLLDLAVSIPLCLSAFVLMRRTERGMRAVEEMMVSADGKPILRSAALDAVAGRN